MGDDTSSAAMPVPAVSVENKSGAQLALALTVFALVLASNSIINDSWLTKTGEVETLNFNSDLGLTQATTESCVGDDCSTEVQEFDSTYSNCTELYDESSMSAEEKEDGKEENCSNWSKYYNAGLVAIIMLIVSSTLLFAAAIMQVRSMLGAGQRIPNLMSFMGGILTATTILVWALMLPEQTDDPEWGQGLWMVILATISALIAGFSGTLQSWIDGPPRMRAHGVRAGLEMNEFVLKESSCGNHTLSILADSDLVRVVRVERIGASPAIKDVLATRRDSYTGFSHQRLDWLDDFKGIWWVLSGASLISSFMISSLFLIPFTIAAILALMQLMDPERFVVSTNSGNHPFYINRWRSNRELTNLAMDLVDDAMIAVLRGEELDTGTLDARSDLIAERFSANRDAKQEAEQAAAAEKATFIEAANQIPEPPAITPLGPPVTEATTPAEPSVTETITPPEAVQQEAAPEDAQTSTEEVQETESMPVEETPPTDSTPPAAVPETEPAPTGPATTSLENTTPAPVVAQPVTIPPPPPLPETIPAPPAIVAPLPAPPAPLPAAIAPPPLPAAIAPPPLPAAIPPPMGMDGMIAPPPPAGAAILPPTASPQPMSLPPPVLVQGAPREENLSEGEKDDLLGELNSN